MQKGILTGCLRIAKESIFTGLNNFTVCSILDEISGNRFGFTNDEVADILSYYQIEQYQSELKNGMMVIYLEKQIYIIHGVRYYMLIN